MLAFKELSRKFSKPIYVQIVSKQLLKNFFYLRQQQLNIHISIFLL